MIQLTLVDLFTNKKNKPTIIIEPPIITETPIDWLNIIYANIDAIIGSPNGIQDTIVGEIYLTEQYNRL